MVKFGFIMDFKNVLEESGVYASKALDGMLESKQSYRAVRGLKLFKKNQAFQQ